MNGSSEKQTIQVGLVMPIALIDNCGPDHWIEVKSIIIEALTNHEKYHFETRIVSESDSSGLIHKRIVQGLYTSDIVICDVSCKNPNVMFELGMRLAFDKPTIIIKDDKTNYSFDTGGIEHIEYPRDLRFAKIKDFKITLLKKVVATYEDSITDTTHSPFLKNFGQFKVAKLEETEVTPTDLIFERLTEIQTDIATLKRQIEPKSYGGKVSDSSRYRLKPAIELAIKDSVNQYINNSDSATVNELDAIRHVTNSGIIPEIPGALLKGYIRDYLDEIGY
ncbi:hypothetical protein [Paenibacillus sp. y28]|uniref:hypothetical protein n=1 Tax=Paenibacillus sp. y28 TaxID=3129110 RepID=UPI0030193D34